MSKHYNLIGQKFGKLTVIKKCGLNSHNEIDWLCKCDCGNEHVTTTNKLIHGTSVQCKQCKYKAVASTNKKRRMGSKKLRHCYNHMLDRCYNKNSMYYKRYGGRGISVCDEWKHSYTAFRDWAFENGCFENLTLDRIDNNGNYAPENCRWATPKEQANNRHTNHMITIGNETKTMAVWARENNINYGTLKSRVLAGWSEDKLLIKPMKMG